MARLKLSCGMNIQEKRLWIIDDCLSKTGFIASRENLKAEVIAQEYEYSDRTFDRDIEKLREIVGLKFPALEEKGEVLIYDRKERIYRYAYSKISAFSSLSDSDILAISKFIQKAGMVDKHALSGNLVQKLKTINVLNQLNEYHSLIHWEPISFQLSKIRNGEQQVDEILKYICEQKLVAFEKSNLYDDKRKVYNGLPLMLREYQNGWYSGWYLLLLEIKTNQNYVHLTKESTGLLRCFALDRVHNLTTINQKGLQIEVEEGFDPANYFKSLFGITRLNLNADFEGSQEVIIEVDYDVWILSYFKNYPVHKSQSIRFDNLGNKAQIHLELEITVELVNFLFSYSDEIKVLQPAVLRNHLMEKLSNAIIKMDQNGTN